MFQTAAGRRKTEDFSGDPGSGSNAIGFIGFGEEGRDDRVMSEWLWKISQADQASSWEDCNERTWVEVVDEFGLVNGVDTAIGEGYMNILYNNLGQRLCAYIAP